MKSSPSIWRYVVNVKSTVKISSIFVAFLENMNFKSACPGVFGWFDSGRIRIVEKKKDD